MRHIFFLVLLIIGSNLLGQTKEENGYQVGTPEINPSAFAPWVFFSWGVAPNNVAGPFNIASTNGGRLFITDGFLSGDQFRIYDNGVDIGSTSLPKSTGDQIGSDIETAALDPRWSSGVFTLSPGAHSIEIEAILNPFDGGAAFYQFAENAAVPTLSEWSLIIVGILFLIFGVVMIRRTQFSLS